MKQGVWTTGRVCLLLHRGINFFNLTVLVVVSIERSDFLLYMESEV